MKLPWDHNDKEVYEACNRAEFKGKVVITLAPIMVALVYVFLHYGDYNILGVVVTLFVGINVMSSLLKDDFLFSKVPGFFLLMSIVMSAAIIITSFANNVPQTPK